MVREVAAGLVWRGADANHPGSIYGAWRLPRNGQQSNCDSAVLVFPCVVGSLGRHQSIFAAGHLAGSRPGRQAVLSKRRDFHILRSHCLRVTGRQYYQSDGTRSQPSPTLFELSARVGRQFLLNRSEWPVLWARLLLPCGSAIWPPAGRHARNPGTSPLSPTRIAEHDLFVEHIG